VVSSQWSPRLLSVLCCYCCYCFCYYFCCFCYYFCCFCYCCYCYCYYFCCFCYYFCCYWVLPLDHALLLVGREVLEVLGDLQLLRSRGGLRLLGGL